MTRRCEVVLLAVFIASLPVTGSNDVTADARPRDETNDVSSNHGNMKYDDDDQCTYEEIIHRKREAVKLQLFAKLKIRSLPNNTRADIPQELIDQFSQIYKQYSRESNGNDRQNEADPETIPPKQNMIFPEHVVKVSDNVMVYKWDVQRETSALDSAELHLPSELVSDTTRAYVLSDSLLSDPESMLKGKKRLIIPMDRDRGVVDVKKFYRKWTEKPESNHGILVSCQNGCFSEESGKKPFISLRIQVSGRQRSKRYGATTAAQSCDMFPDKCCYEDHYLTFEELGLDHVILEPTVFNVGLCLGVCEPMWMEDSYHSHVISHVQSTEGPRNCCAPKTITDLEVFYYDSEMDDTRLITIPNMLVRECGCK